MFLCHACKLGKLAHMPLASIEHTSTTPIKIIHSDVWGTAPLLSNLGYSYFLLFIDDFTRFTWIYFLKNKSQVFSMFQEFESLVSRQFNSKIKNFHSDWGGKYKKFNTYFKQNGIIHRIACPYTHEHNGISERKISHIVNNGLTLMAHDNIPLRFWSYAFQTSVQLINYMPSRVLQNSNPFELLYNKPPNYTDLKIFGCAVYPWLRPYNKHKFSFRTQNMHILVILPLIMVICVLTLIRIKYMLLVMSLFMKLLFHLKLYH